MHSVNSIYSARLAACADLFFWFRSATVVGAGSWERGEAAPSCVNREVLLENATVSRWSKAHVIFLIKEWSAAAQRRNSSRRKVTCNDDPSRWIWRLSFQYPAPWLMQRHTYLKMLRLPHNKIHRESWFQHYHTYIYSQLSIYILNWAGEFIISGLN